MSEQVEGAVKWVNDLKGFGFIEQSDARDIFVHYSVIIGDGRRTLVEGKKVIMEITQTEKGLQAANGSPTNSNPFASINLKSDQKSSLYNCFIVFINKHKFSFLPKIFLSSSPFSPQKSPFILKPGFK